jgi:carboxylesterase type B
MYFSFAVLISLANLIYSYPSPPIHANTGQGTVQGFSPVQGVEAFLGISYALPPVDQLRFKPPQDFSQINRTNGNGTVHDGRHFGPVCYQLHYTSVLGTENLRETEGQNEDCLTLNVWRPANKTSEPLPVMIWLYGGAFSEGSTSAPGRLTRLFGLWKYSLLIALVYNPEALVQQNPEVIVVTLK